MNKSYVHLRHFFIAASFGLSGCVVGPAYVAPAPPQAAAFRSAGLQASVAPAATGWAGFGDPELSALVGRALAQNLDLAQAEARVLQARAQARAAGAALLPAAGLNAQAAAAHLSRRSPIGEVVGAVPGLGRDQSLYDLNAGAAWEVWGAARRERVTRAG